MPKGEYRIVQVQETGENGYLSRSFTTREAAQKWLDEQELREKYSECRFFVEYLDLSSEDDEDFYPDYEDDEV
jgi:hypothetical protein